MPAARAADVRDFPWLGFIGDSGGEAHWGCADHRADPRAGVELWEFAEDPHDRDGRMPRFLLSWPEGAGRGWLEGEAWGPIREGLLALHRRRMN